MAVLGSPSLDIVVLALALAPACYSPDLRDCAVTCESSADCAGAQVCGADHFCAAPAIAGTCARLRRDAGASGDVDAPGAAPDAPHGKPHDAPPPVDAPPMAALHLHVDGHGALVAGVRTCTMDCTYAVPPGVPIDVDAVPASGQMFDSWTMGPCVGSTSTSCLVTPVGTITVGVRFRKTDH